MTVDGFKGKAIQVLKSQRFANLPLFDADYLDEYEISDIQGSMDFEEFIELLYEEIKEEVGIYTNGFTDAIDKALTEIEYHREQTDSGEKCAAYDDVIGILRNLRDCDVWDDCSVHSCDNCEYREFWRKENDTARTDE